MNWICRIFGHWRKANIESGMSLESPVVVVETCRICGHVQKRRACPPPPSQCPDCGATIGPTGIGHEADMHHNAGDERHFYHCMCCGWTMRSSRGTKNKATVFVARPTKRES